MSILYLFSSFYFIVPIAALIFIYVSLNNKISKLKERVDALTAGSVQSTVQTPSATQPTTPMQTQTVPVMQSTTAPSPVFTSPTSAIPATFATDSVAQNISAPSSQAPKPQISGEEKSGKLLGKIGVIAILLAGAFFLKDVPDEGKVMIGLIVGIIFIGVGFYLREKYKTYAHVLMGGGIAVLYLTVFAATTVFKMMPSTIGFGFMIFVTIVAIVISIMEDAVELAALGAFGGFLTPILIPTADNNYLGLFSYLLVLDLGILVVSFRKRWLNLYHIGFWGTGLIFFVWCAGHFNSNLLAPSMMFLTLYFVIFLLASVFHHFVRREKTNPADIFGIAVNAILYFSTSMSLLYSQYHENLGYFSLVLAIVYAMMAYVSFTTMKEDKVLNYLLSGISVVFLSITIPLQLTGSWITLAWLIEALVLYAMAFYIPHEPLKKFGAIVFALGIGRLVFYDELARTFGSAKMEVAFFNLSFILLIIAVLIAYTIQYLYSKFDNKEDSNVKKTMAVLVLVANVLTIFGITSQIYLHYKNQERSLRNEFTVQSQQFESYRGNSGYSEDMQKRLSSASRELYTKVDSLNNQRNTMVSVFWAIYAILLIMVGFMKKAKFLRTLGLIFFVITAIKIFFDVWSLGTQYRVISLVVFGVVALLGSFGYAKYKNKIIN